MGYFVSTRGIQGTHDLERHEPGFRSVYETKKGKTMSALNQGHKDILDQLMEGNERYVSGLVQDRDLITDRGNLVDGQSPRVAMIRCADSRVSPELVFDLTLGEIFVCGVAGNIPTDEIMASLEYAVSNLGTELIVVMGHSQCGAVSATLANQDKIDSLPGNLPGLLSQILPSVLAVESGSENELADAVERNAADAAIRVPLMSKVIEEAVREGRVAIVSGVYDLASGRFILTD